MPPEVVAAVDDFARETGHDALLLDQAAAVACGDSTALDLSQVANNMRIVRVPKAVVNLGTIETLGLARSVPHTDTESFAHKMATLGERDLKRIDLEGNQMTEVPEAILAMPRLQSLSLRDNALRRLPPSIAQLGHVLVELDVRANFLEELPEAIGTLRCLRLLSCGRNVLRALPASLGDLTRLVTLWLSHNLSLIHI